MQSILITGASSGIGEALAYYYASVGVKNLFICGRNQERLEAVKQNCEAFGATVDAKVLDVTDREKTQNWILEADKKQPLDLVVANAGVSTTQGGEDAVYKTFNTNVFGVLNTVHPALDVFLTRKDLKKNNAQIAIVASIAGYHGLASCPSYSASKACVKAYGEALRVRYAADGIKINVICPGFVHSRITQKNQFPMPFIMDADKAAKLIAKGIEKNRPIISFPNLIRFATWFISILPNAISDKIYAIMPYKV